ncbi:MAG: hypothetical protein ACYCUI_07810 [Vulcanimicrobiaceae bacterium]
MSEAERELLRLAIAEPAEYERRLHSYFLILGERRLWWQRCAEAEDPRWRACVRAAIIALATRSQCLPAWLAEALELDDALLRTRRRILRMARERLASAERAA